jgi:hypothetical protein
MAPPDSDELLVARWVAGQVGAGPMLDIAVRALAEGRGGGATVALAAASPGESDGMVAPLIGPALVELGLPMPSDSKALKLLVDNCARQVVTGAVNPPDGGRQLWLWSDEPAVGDQLLPFVALMSQWTEAAAPWAEHHADASELEDEIVVAARRLLEMGGLRIEP